MENTAGHLQVFYTGQGGIARYGFDRVNVTDLSSANSLPHRRIARVESPIKRAKERPTDSLCLFVAAGRVCAILCYRLLAKDRLLSIQSLDDDILVGESRRRHDDRVDAAPTTDENDL